MKRACSSNDSVVHTDLPSGQPVAVGGGLPPPLVATREQL